MKDRWLSVFALSAVVVIGLIFFVIVGDVLSRGAVSLSWDFLVELPERAGREGGILSVLVSTLLILSICISVTVVIGMGCAVYLSDAVASKPGFHKWVERSLDLLSGMPSILFGLFGNAFFCKTLGLGFSILSGGLTLACMALPLFIRTSQLGLQMVPVEYRHSAEALGLSRWTRIRVIVLPVALPSLLAGLALSIGRALAETAALIFTSGYVSRMPENLLDSGRALSVHIYDLSMNIPGGDVNAYRSACVLLVVILLVNLGVSFGATRVVR